MARRYAEFLEAVVAGDVAGRRQARRTAGRGANPLPRPRRRPPTIPPELAGYLRGWATNDEAAQYSKRTRRASSKTLEITPPGGPCDRILEMGAYLQITPALRTKLGYGEVRGCYYGPAGRIDHRIVTSAEGETFACDIDHFDAEKDRFPYPDEHFSTVLCGELIEHLFEDPMHLMGEVNRILKPGGHLVLTTPNVASLRGISAILQGYHPGLFPRLHQAGRNRAKWMRATIASTRRGRSSKLLENSGFDVALLETGEFRDLPHPEFALGAAPAASATAWKPICAATASTPWAARPGR